MLEKAYNGTLSASDLKHKGTKYTQSDFVKAMKLAEKVDQVMEEEPMDTDDNDGPSAAKTSDKAAATKKKSSDDGEEKAASSAATVKTKQATNKDKSAAASTTASARKKQVPPPPPRPPPPTAPPPPVSKAASSAGTAAAAARASKKQVTSDNAKEQVPKQGPSRPKGSGNKPKPKVNEMSRPDSTATQQTKDAAKKAKAIEEDAPAERSPKGSKKKHKETKIDLPKNAAGASENTETKSLSRSDELTATSQTKQTDGAHYRCACRADALLLHSLL